MTVQPPRKDDDDQSSLASAKQKLSEVPGRPFEVDTILAHQRAKHEREMEAGKVAAQKLEEVHKAAQKRKILVRAKKAEIESKQAKEKASHVEVEEWRLREQLKKRPDDGSGA